MKEKEIKYYINKHKQLNLYVLYKFIHKGNGYGIKGIFFGTRKECQEKLKEIKAL